MGCIPGTLAGFIRGSVLLVAGILTDSDDARALGKRVAMGKSGDAPEHAPLKEVVNSAATLAAMRRELQDWKQQLLRHKSQGAKGTDLRKLQKQLGEREEALRQLEERHRKLEQDAKNYPLPAYLKEAGYEGTLNVAVTGSVGVGKSLLVNGLRRVSYGDGEWAPVGVKSTTTAPHRYEFPGDPSVRLWDLPGSGSKEYPRDMYIARVGLRYFDVVLVLTGCRFTSTDHQLLKELAEWEVPHFVVRTMLDIDIASGKEDSDLDEETTIKSIREELDRKGVVHPYLLNARKPDDHDFQQLQSDVVKALAVTRCCPRDPNRRRRPLQERLGEKPVYFEVGEPAEVVVLDGSQAGTWIRCDITGVGEAFGTYQIFLPDAPPDKRDIPNVHVSALRKVRSQPPDAQEDGAKEQPPDPERKEPVKLLDTRTAIGILEAFKETAAKGNFQATISGISKQQPETEAVRKMKANFITQSLSPALRAFNLPFPRELSPVLLESVGMHRDVREVRVLAHEVEKLLGFAAGAYFGIPPEPPELRLKGFPRAIEISLRESWRIARSLANSWLALGLTFAFGFFDTATNLCFPFPLFYGLMFLFRSRTYSRWGYDATTRRYWRFVVPFIYALGNTLATAMFCLLFQRHGTEDFVALLIPDLKDGEGDEAGLGRRSLKSLGHLGYFLVRLLAGSCLSWDVTLAATLEGMDPATMLQLSFLVSFIRSILDNEMFCTIARHVLAVIPFAKEPDNLPPGERSSVLAMRKAVDNPIREMGASGLYIIFGVSYMASIAKLDGIRSLLFPLKHALHYLYTVEDPDAPFIDVFKLPVLEATAAVLACGQIHFFAGYTGVNSLEEFMGVQGVLRVEEEVKTYGALAVFVRALNPPFAIPDSWLAAASGIHGCSRALTVLALFVAVALRTLLSLEFSQALARGLESWAEERLDKDE